MCFSHLGWERSCTLFRNFSLAPVSKGLENAPMETVTHLIEFTFPATAVHVSERNEARLSLSPVFFRLHYSRCLTSVRFDYAVVMYF